MSRLIARILQAILVFPLGAMIHLVLFFLLVEWQRRTSNYSRYDTEFIMAFTALVTASFVAVYWILLWKSSVNWTKQRIGQTIVTGVGALVAAVAVGSIVGKFEEEVGVFAGGVCAPILWLLCTTFIWRENKYERAARLSSVNRNTLVCPTCGYNLTGLSESRCPECGSQFTLNELLASQPHKEVDELSA